MNESKNISQNEMLLLSAPETYAVLAMYEDKETNNWSEIRECLRPMLEQRGVANPRRYASFYVTTMSQIGLLENVGYSESADVYEAVYRLNMKKIEELEEKVNNIFSSKQKSC